MEKLLVIVESPAKAKTINKYLGANYIVTSSVGHIRDLPTGKGVYVSDETKKILNKLEDKKLTSIQKSNLLKKKEKAKLFDRMGINPDKNWEAFYEILPVKQKTVKKLQDLAKKSTTIYLATDLDREGEAIAWHLKEVIGGDPAKYKRVVFNEITKRAIEQAFDSPGILNTNRINAQQARRFLDRLVGFMVSPLLWKKVARGLSAGRVQSVAVRLIVDREREIKQFVPKEYWELYLKLQTKAQGIIDFQVTKYQNKKFDPTNKQQIAQTIAELKKQQFVLTAKEVKTAFTKPSPPFITSTLQQAASTKLGFSVKKTMMLAQRLYELGYITYMRTDSTSLSNEAVTSARDYILKKFGNKYLPKEPIVYKSKSSAQEAHEAIRPSSTIANIEKLDRDAKRLYDLIYQQYIACQMTPAEYLNTTLYVDVANYQLKAKGRILVFDGFTKVISSYAKADDYQIPNINIGDQLNLIAENPKQLFTKPPFRYSEASLVKELEKRHIGRPSTYASIISTIQDRGYVSIKNKRIYAEKIGEVVTDRLTESFDNIMNYDFTANLEEYLDEIATGNKDWKLVLDEFYKDLNNRLLASEDKKTGMRANEAVMIDLKCNKCGRNMMIKVAVTGVFLSCSGYSLPVKERCKSTLNLIKGEEIAKSEDEIFEVNELRAKKRCDICNSAMDVYLIDKTKKLHVCGNNPDCSGYKIETGEFKLKGYDGPTLECDKCSAEMQLKDGRFGKYFGCTNSECRNTRKLLKSGQPAPPKMNPVKIPELKCAKVDDFFVLRDGSSGLFLAASGFPKNRETRSPLLLEIIAHKHEVDKKYHYIFEAPKYDPDKNPSIIRFSRKNKEHYLASEKNGKATKWKSFYRNGHWVNEKK